MDLHLEGYDFDFRGHLWPDEDTGSILVATIVEDEFFNGILDLSMPVLTTIFKEGENIRGEQIRAVTVSDEGEQLDPKIVYEGFKGYYDIMMASPTFAAAVLSGIGSYTDFNVVNGGIAGMQHELSMIQHIQTRSGRRFMRIHTVVVEGGRFRKVGNSHCIDHTEMEIPSATALKFAYF
jgi:hypothetical protein